MIVRPTLPDNALKYLSMKKLSWFSLFFSFCTAIVGSQAQAANILVFGDSLSAGHGLELKQEWPALLTERLKEEKLDSRFTVINASISGETTAGGLSRFADTFNKHTPALVILELGANDGLRGLPLATMRENLAAMIRYSLNHQARVLLVSMKIPPNYGKRYTEEFTQSFPQLQKEHGIFLTDFLLGGLSGHPELIQEDGIHPTAAAQPILLETVWKSLKPLLQEAG